MRVLAGDIGGTKVLMRLVDIGAERRQVIAEKRYESAFYPTFDSLLSEFLYDQKEIIDAACFAVAGPVADGKASVTNLTWSLDGNALESRHGIGTVALVNDFFAVATGVPLLENSDVISLNEGTRDTTWPVAIVGAGTGLGEAVVIPVLDAWSVVASEGGHADFAPVDDLQIELLKRLSARYGHVSYERLLSGEGLVNIFNFLRDREGLRTDSAAELADEEVSLPARISEMARDGDPLAVRTFEIFVEIYGAEAGNLALKVLPRGGVYIAGGIAPRNLERFSSETFMRGFTNKGRFAGFMRQFPVDLINNPAVGLMGAEWIASRLALSSVP